jgi:hypothetical protein
MSEAGPRPPGFWRTVRLLLAAAHKRAVGRRRRQRQLLRNRTGESAVNWGGWGYAAVMAWMAFVHGAAAYAVIQVVRSAERLDEGTVAEGLQSLSTGGPVPRMLGSIVLLWWGLMLVCQGEGLELDVQKRRHPMWEWLLSHPVRPAAVFVAEMLSPIAANPLYVTAPLFPAILYGAAYRPLVGILAVILVGIPITVAAASLGKGWRSASCCVFPRGPGARFLDCWDGSASR